MEPRHSYEALHGSRSVAELIETERANLSQVHGMARCLYDVLLYADDDDATMHADVAKVIARLIEESVDQLEKIVKRVKSGELGPTPNQASGGVPIGSQSS